jgi:hypothetical protein
MTEPTADPGTPGTTPNPEPEPAPGAAAKPPTFEERMERFGEEVGAAGERFGREAEAFGQRLANDPSVRRAGDTAARIWGLIILAVGAWFFVDVTLGYDMPAVPWSDVWPIGLIAIGLLVVLRGMTRRSA